MADLADLHPAKVMEMEIDTYCIKNIAPNQKHWLVQIGHKIINFNYLRDDTVWNRNFVRSDLCETGAYRTGFSPPMGDELILHQAVEDNPLASFNAIVELSIQNPLIIMRLAKFLSHKSVDIICKRVFTNKNMEMQFVSSFYELFIPVYLRRAYSWFTIDLLFRAKKAYPELFKNLILELIKDTEVKSVVLQDYVQNVNDRSRNEFMKSMIELRFTPYEFSYNLTTIYYAFKDCEMDESIFQFIFNNLERHGYYCIYNKNFGRLLHVFIEQMPGYNVSLRVLKIIINKHCTSYKSICISAFDNYVLGRNDLQAIHPQPSIFTIPRPEETLQL